MSACGSRSKIINDVDSVVTESLKGITLSNPSVITLNFGKIIIMKDYMNSKNVQIVSGGGAGHEPMFTGYVGKGMLNAAIHGDIFSSPPASDITKLFKELAIGSNKGLFLIIQNYSGERLHFGLAVERAKNEGIHIESLIVDDDCYQMKSWKGKSGVSGIVLVQKIAGAMAQDYMELADIYSFCEKAVNEIRSISFSVHKSSSLRGLCACVRENLDIATEFGVSLNGEPGVPKIFKTATEICQFLLDEITSPDVANPIQFDPEVSYVLLINNLGIATKIEELIFTKEILCQLYERNIKIVRVYYGRFVTALNTAGFSVTFLKVFEKQVLRYLDAPTQVSAWGISNQFDLSSKLDRTICSKIKTTNQPIPQIGPTFSLAGSNTTMMIIQFACDALSSCENQLNTIDLETGDGDAGTRIRRGVEVIDDAIKTKNLNILHPFTLLATLSAIIEKHIEGSLGLIYSVFFEAASGVFRVTPETEPITVHMWSKSLTDATAAVKRYTRTTEGCRTIYDPLYVCSTLLQHGLNFEGISTIEAVGLSVSAAEETAQKTKMANAKYPDSGAHSIAILLRAVFEGLKSRWLED